MAPVRRYQLANGMWVVVDSEPWLPLVAVRVRYRVGSVHDPPGRKGLAHLVEHLTYRGTKHLGDGELFWHLARLSAIDYNATTRFWSTDYYETVPSRDLESALWIEAERMQFFRRPRAEHVAGELSIVTAENVYRHSGHSLDRFEALYAALFPAPHPYHQLSDDDELRNTTVEDIERFAAQHMGPANATVVIAGDVPSDIDRMIERAFGELRGGRRPQRPSGLDTQLTRPVELDKPFGYRANAQLVWRLPQPATEQDEATALVLALSFDHRAPAPELAGLQWIQGKVFENEAGTYGLSIEAESAADDPATTVPIIDEALARLGDEGLTDSMLKRAKRRGLRQYASHVEALPSRTSELADLSERRGHADLDARTRAIDTVRHGDVRELARRLDSRRVVILTRGEAS